MTPHSLQQIDLGSVTVSGSNSTTLYPSAPIQVLQVGCVITTATTVAASIMTAAATQTTGAALSPSGAALFTMTIPVAAINTGVYLDVTAVEGRLILYPGEVLTLTSNGGSTAGAARFFAIVDLLGMNDAALRLATAPGATTHATSLAALTKVTS